MWIDCTWHAACNIWLGTSVTSWQAVPTCGRGQCPLRCQSRSSHPTWWHDVDTFDRLRHYGMHKHSSKTFGSLGACWCSCFLPWTKELLLIWQRGKFYRRIFVGGCLTSSAGIMNPYCWYFWYCCCVWVQQHICSLGLSCFNFLMCCDVLCVHLFRLSTSCSHDVASVSQFRKYYTAVPNLEIEATCIICTL